MLDWREPNSHLPGAVPVEVGVPLQEVLCQHVVAEEPDPELAGRQAQGVQVPARPRGVPPPAVALLHGQVYQRSSAWAFEVQDEGGDVM